ncbi:MAG: metallopeptidase family protein [Rhizomicrobium sp.]
MSAPVDEPSLDDMQSMARAEFAALPEEFRALTGDIIFVLAEEPDAATLQQLGLSRTSQLLGVYRGAPLAARLANLAGAEPSMIFLFRRAILHYAKMQELALAAVLRHVLIHEIGHYFGLSDETMGRLSAE